MGPGRGAEANRRRWKVRGGPSRARRCRLCVLIGLVCIGVVTVIGDGVQKFFGGVPPVGSAEPPT
jgi:hypothetical protein